MKIAAIITAASVASVSAFMPSSKVHQGTQLGVATKGKIGPVKKAISGITKDNFSSTLAEIEPFFLEDAGITIYSKSMRRIAVKAKELDLEMPENYAKEAKCTLKRREKQNAFCQMKAEEAAAAAAEAAEAEADAEAEESTEDEAPAEE